MILAPQLTLENAHSFSKTDLAHMVITYKAVAERLTAELASLEQVGE